MVRLVDALKLEHDDKWTVSRRYMPVEKLTATCDDIDAATHDLGKVNEQHQL